MHVREGAAGQSEKVHHFKVPLRVGNRLRGRPHASLPGPRRFIHSSLRGALAHSHMPSRWSVHRSSPGVAPKLQPSPAPKPLSFVGAVTAAVTFSYLDWMVSSDSQRLEGKIESELNTTALVSALLLTLFTINPDETLGEKGICAPGMLDADSCAAGSLVLEWLSLCFTMVSLGLAVALLLVTNVVRGAAEAPHALQRFFASCPRTMRLPSCTCLSGMLFYCMSLAWRLLSQTDLHVGLPLFAYAVISFAAMLSVYTYAVKLLHDVLFLGREPTSVSSLWARTLAQVSSETPFGFAAVVAGAASSADSMVD